jgi:hypothetical protein
MNHEEKDEKPQPANEEHGAPPDAPPLSGRVAVLTIVILLILAVVVAIAGIVPRVRARTRLTQQTNTLAAPAVIAKPQQVVFRHWRPRPPGAIISHHQHP